MLLLHRMHSLLLKPDEMALIGIGVYLFVRFGLTNMIRKYTVHRGMFHSIPAGLVFAGVAFLIVGDSFDINIRYFKAGAVLAGFMSHLILDEIYSVEWKGGAWRLKKSSGTAVKLWGDDAWANFTTYTKLIIVAGIILGEPSVMEQIQSRRSGAGGSLPAIQGRYRGWSDEIAGASAANCRSMRSGSRDRAGVESVCGTATASAVSATPAQSVLPTAPANFRRRRAERQSVRPAARRNFRAPPASNGFDTAQRPQWPGSSSSRRSQVCCVDPQRHRAVVHQRHVHVCAKHAGRHFDAERPHARDEFVVQPLGKLRRRGVGEARPPAFAAIAEERELAHDQHRPADFDERAIHLAVVIFEHPQTDDLLREPIDLRRTILRPHAQQHQQAAADLARHRAVDRHPGLAHSLNTRSHRCLSLLGS